jgi:hypothetical protein
LGGKQELKQKRRKLDSDPELDTKLDSIRAGKKAKRKRSALKLVIVFIPFTLAISGVYGPTFDKNFPTTLFAISALVTFPALLFALVFGGKMLGRVIYPLDPVEKAFLSLYNTLSYKEPLEGKKYDPVVQDDIRSLMRNVSLQLNQPNEVAGILLEEADDLLLDTIYNIKNRLLPASEVGLLTRKTMRQLAIVLADPTIDGLREFNNDVEAEYEEKEKGIPWKTRGSEFFKSQPGHIVQSLVFGFGVTFFTVYAFSVLLQQSFGSVFTQYAGFILGGVFGLTASYLGYLAVQRRSTKRYISD